MKEKIHKKETEEQIAAKKPQMQRRRQGKNYSQSKETKYENAALNVSTQN